MSDWRSLVKEDTLGEEMECFRLHERTGRPLGDEAFVERMEQVVFHVRGGENPGRERKKPIIRYTVPGTFSPNSEVLRKIPSIKS